MLKFELSEQMVAIIAAALRKAPYEQVVSVLEELQRQLNAQQKKPPEAAVDEAA